MTYVTVEKLNFYLESLNRFNINVNTILNQCLFGVNKYINKKELKPYNNTIRVYRILKPHIDLNKNNIDFIVEKVINSNLHLKKQNKTKINMKKKN